MYTEVIFLKRKAGMTQEEFQAYYRDRHGPLVVKLLGENGLVSYEHFPIEKPLVGALESQFDAISIYTFESEEKANLRHHILELAADSAACMEIATLVSFQTGRRQVFPVK